MRYKVVIYTVIDAYVCVVTAYGQDEERGPIYRALFTIPFEDLKHDDIMHVLGELYRAVSEVTP